MKLIAIALLGVSILLSSPPTKQYKNNYCGFKLRMPTVIEYSLYEIEPDEAADSTVMHFITESFELKLYPQELKLSSGRYMNTADFGENSYQACQQQDKLGQYTNGKYVSFLGERAYQFDAVKSFEERGLMVAEKSPYLAKEKFMRQSEGRLLQRPHRIIYFSHRKKFFRIIYPINDKVANQLVRSLE